ncbi:MAG: glycosyltransferase family 39 protein [Phycisphaerae bacterium]|nr:glycosyltransferase family 39 protein [Phycisphaerae bacterium]
MTPTNQPPASSHRTFQVLVLITALGAVLFLVGVDWGLPSRQVDPYLFGGHLAWSGERIAELANVHERDSDQRGADVDVDPLSDRTRRILLNATDTDRAAILLRYRLYSAQPDEMVTMMSLARMRPGAGDFDPRLYQYGGLFIYPVGALLKTASLAGAITVKSDLTYYLDEPAEFGRFYVVGRAYVATWGLLGIPGLFWLTRRLARDWTDARTATRAGVLAALFYVLMPVVITMAHEAKPHLPGAVLMLYATLAATRYADRGTSQWAIIAGIAAGAAFGMVLSALPVFLVLPLMALLRPTPRRQQIAHAAMACTVAFGTYVATNPYVVINLLFRPEVVFSNLGNTAALFEWSHPLAGLLNVAGLIAEGMSPPLAIAGVLGLGVLCVRGDVTHFPKTITSPTDTGIPDHAHGCPTETVRKMRDVPLRPNAAQSVEGDTTHFRTADEMSEDTTCTDAAYSAPDVPSAKMSNVPVVWLLLVPAACVFAQIVGPAAGKPGEYGRFALFPDLALTITAAVALTQLSAQRRRLIAVITLLLIVCAAAGGGVYVNAFLRDSRRQNTRITCAAQIEQIAADVGLLTVGLFAEPAPYSVPPLNWIDHTVWLLPRDATPETVSVLPDIIVSTTDDMVSAPLHTWAARYRRLEFGPLFGTPRISWANKPVVLLVRDDEGDVAHFSNSTRSATDTRIPDESVEGDTTHFRTADETSDDMTSTDAAYFAPDIPSTKMSNVPGG